MSQVALGEALRIDRTAMVSLLDELEQRGYLVGSDIRETGGPFSSAPPRPAVTSRSPPSASSTSSSAGFCLLSVATSVERSAPC
jgi:hypothetical protein